MDPAASEHQSLVALAKEITADAKKVISVVERIRAEVEEGSTEKGLSILELKNNLMLEYLTNLSYVALRKTEGMKIEGELAIERLVTNRTVLEKIRPIEQKLKYQIDKAVKVADSGQVSAKDPMNFKANPSALVSKLGDGEEDDEEEEDDETADGNAKGGAKDGRKDGKYVAPKNVPAYYEEERESKEAEDAKRRKKQQLSKAMIEDLKRQHLDTPEEVFDREDVMRKKQINTARERTRFEEEHFYRLPLTKKDRKASRKKLSTVGSIGDEVTSFGSNYFSAREEEGGGGSSKKRKRGSGAKGSKKKKKFK